MNTTRVDVHAHFLPDFYRDALVAAGQTHPDGMAAIPHWSEGEALAAMDTLRVRSAMLSISSPGVHFGDDAAAGRLARRVNEEGARLMQAHPGRFGLFAATPLPDVGAAIEEARYALDELGADGIGVETNHHGLYLGDRALEPFYAELDSREAVLFVHPTSPACQGSDTAALGYPKPMLEFMFETTRSVTQLVLSGVTVRYPNLRIIVPHAGAALPVLASRVDMLMALYAGPSAPTGPTLSAELRKFYYDLAGAPLPELLDALLQVTDPGHLLYGSDWPFTPVSLCEELAAGLDATPLLEGTQREAAMNGNARALFTRLARG